MAERKYAVLTMEMEEQSLEKIFLSLTGTETGAVNETVVDFEPVEDDDDLDVSEDVDTDVAEDAEVSDGEEDER